MIDPAVAGVAFSRNPATGVREVVIEATAGLGGELVAGRARPERWVRKRGEWLLTPDAPRLTYETASRVADGVERIGAAFGRAVDVEWAFDGTLWWLQARPVTAGANVAVYSSKMARDMLPGVIYPLVWSINGPMMSATFARFLDEAFGPTGVRAADLAMIAAARAGRGRPERLTIDDFIRRHRLGARLRRASRRTARFQTARDETSSLYTYTYGQFRPLALRLGELLAEHGALERSGDVFYLSVDEVVRFADGALGSSDVRAIAAERAEEVAAARLGEPPEVVTGEVAELVRMPECRLLRGIACSRGRYTGRVTVCRGSGDVCAVEAGDVVVVPYSDVSWEPVFRQAGAIIAESGGILSHSAILSRELGIPAVVSVRGALTLLSGTIVSVDGFEGTVTVVRRPDGADRAAKEPA